MSLEDGNAAVETNNTAASAICVDADMDKFDSANWPDS